MLFFFRMNLSCPSSKFCRLSVLGGIQILLREEGDKKSGGENGIISRQYGKLGHHVVGVSKKSLIMRCYLHSSWLVPVVVIFVH